MSPIFLLYVSIIIFPIRPRTSKSDLLGATFASSLHDQSTAIDKIGLPSRKSPRGRTLSQSSSAGDLLTMLMSDDTDENTTAEKHSHLKAEKHSHLNSGDLLTMTITNENTVTEKRSHLMTQEDEVFYKITDFSDFSSLLQSSVKAVRSSVTDFIKKHSDDAERKNSWLEWEDIQDAFGLLMKGHSDEYSDSKLSVTPDGTEHK